jgi:hypothetical protein
MELGKYLLYKINSYIHKPTTVHELTHCQQQKDEHDGDAAKLEHL